MKSWGSSARRAGRLYTARVRTVASGVWHIPGFPTNWINVYLVEDVLIDASRRGAGPAIVKELGGRALSMVALTHVHPDHQGSAHFLCEKFGIPLTCHAEDLGAMEGTVPMPPGTWAAKISNMLFSGPPHPVDHVLAEGDEVGGFRVYHTPGHTPGHVTFFRESDGVAIAGDVLNAMDLRTAIPGLHQPPAYFSSDPRQNRASIRLLAEMDPAVICLGHGPVVRDRPRFREFVRRLPAD